MSKPDDIPQDVWDVAQRAFTKCRDMEAKWCDGTGPEAIARAIQTAKAEAYEDMRDAVDAAIRKLGSE